MLTDLEYNAACEPAQLWLDALPEGTAAAEAYALCPRGGWLIWLAKRRGVDRAVVVRAAREATRCAVGRQAAWAAEAWAWTWADVDPGRVARAAAQACGDPARIADAVRTVITLGVLGVSDV